MNRYGRCAACVPLLVALWAAGARADDLPAKAQKAIQKYDEDVAAIQKKAEQQINAAKEGLIGQLQELQEAYTKAGKLDEAVAIRDRIRLLKAGFGKDVEVQWGGQWWPAQVLQAKDGKYLIHYDGYGDDQNEWVPPDRIRPRDGKTRPELGTGRKVEAEWGGTWYPAQVLQSKEGKYFIHYDGYGDEWNEWVPSNRIRPPGKENAGGRP